MFLLSSRKTMFLGAFLSIVAELITGCGLAHAEVVSKQADCHVLSNPQASAILGRPLAGPTKTVGLSGRTGCQWSSHGGRNSILITWVPRMAGTPEQYYRSQFRYTTIPSRYFHHISGAGPGAIEVLSGGSFGAAILKHGDQGLEVSLNAPGSTPATIALALTRLANEVWAVWA
jgi:hypothetical protein